MSVDNQMKFNLYKNSLARGLKEPMDFLFKLAKNAYLKGYIDNIAKIKIDFLVVDNTVWFYADPYFKPKDKSILNKVQMQTTKPAKDLIGICARPYEAKYTADFAYEYDALVRFIRYYSIRKDQPNKHFENVLNEYTVRLKKLLFKMRYKKLVSENKLDKEKLNNEDIWRKLQRRVAKSSIWQLDNPKQKITDARQTIKLTATNDFNKIPELLAFAENEPLAFATITIKQGKIINYEIKANLNEKSLNLLKRNKIDAIDLELILDKLEWLKGSVIEAETAFDKIIKPIKERTK